MLQGFQFAIRLIRKRPLRMGLILLQIGVGVAAVTIVLSFVFNLLEPTPGLQGTEGIFWTEMTGEKIEGDRKMRVTSSFFTQEMVKDFQTKSNFIQEMSLIDRGYRGTIQYQQLRYQFRNAFWVGSEYARLMELEIMEGSFFTDADLANANQVILISEEANTQLFGEESGVGKKLLIDTQGGHDEMREVQIIGVYKNMAPSGLMAHDSPHFLFPISFRGYEGTFNLLVRFKPARIQEGKDELSMLFEHEYDQSSQPEHMQMETYGLEFTAYDTFGAENRQEIAKTFGLFIGSFAFVALVISSIGILSMMLVSIVERTREIGLRRALGASRLSIVGQIISESMIVSFFGGLIGIGLAYLGIGPIFKDLVMKYIFREMFTVDVHVTLSAILISLASVMVVGVVAGLYPGIQASRLAPLEAVRDGK